MIMNPKQTCILGLAAMTGLAASASTASASPQFTTLDAYGWTCAANYSSESRNCYQVAGHFCRKYSYRGATRFRLKRTNPGKVGHFRWVVCFR